LGKKSVDFLRHDFVCGRDLDDFFDVARVEQKRNLRFAGVNRSERVCRFAFVGEIRFLGDGTAA